MPRAKSPYNEYRIIDNFDEIIILAIIRLESIAYGVNIYNRINMADPDNRYSQTRVYAALHLLWKRGLIECRHIRIDGGVRKCRVYNASASGIAMINRLKGIRHAIETA